MGWGGTVLYPESVMVYECIAGKPVSEFVETNRAHFIGGTDGKGVDLVPNKEDTHINGTTVQVDHKNKPSA
jgi:hypothetical protein